MNALILHEPYEISWPSSGRSLRENMYYCVYQATFFYGKQTHHIIEFSSLFSFTGSQS